MSEGGQDVSDSWCKDDGGDEDGAFSKGNFLHLIVYLD